MTAIGECPPETVGTTAVGNSCSAETGGPKTISTSSWHRLTGAALTASEIDSSESVSSSELHSQSPSQRNSPRPAGEAAGTGSLVNAGGQPTARKAVSWCDISADVLEEVAQDPEEEDGCLEFGKSTPSKRPRRRHRRKAPVSEASTASTMHSDDEQAYAGSRRPSDTPAVGTPQKKNVVTWDDLLSGSNGNNAGRSPLHGMVQVSSPAHQQAHCAPAGMWPTSPAANMASYWPLSPACHQGWAAPSWSPGASFQAFDEYRYPAQAGCRGAEVICLPSTQHHRTHGQEGSGADVSPVLSTTAPMGSPIRPGTSDGYDAARPWMCPQSAHLADYPEAGAGPVLSTTAPCESPKRTGTNGHDALRSWLDAQGLPSREDLAQQLVAVAPEAYED